MEEVKRNHLGRIAYDVSDDLTIWLEDHEHDFLLYLEDLKSGFIWMHEATSSLFTTSHDQNSFIKRMLKYGVLYTDHNINQGPYKSGIIIFHKNTTGPKKLHMTSGHNLEQWIRDHWDKYSTETMEVALVKGAFDTPDHYQIYIAHKGLLNSYTIDPFTDETVMEDLYKIEKEIEL